MKIGYARVSTLEQNIERQEIHLKEAQCEEIFLEKASGKNTARPELNEMLGFIRAGDTVIVSDFSRLARNTKDLLDITSAISAKGATFKSLKENIDSTTPTGKLMLTVIGAIAEFEREALLQRQKEGIELAKQKGKFKKKELKIPLDFEDMKQKLEFNKKRLASHYGVSRPIIYKWINAVKESIP